MLSHVTPGNVLIALAVIAGVVWFGRIALRYEADDGRMPAAPQQPEPQVRASVLVSDAAEFNARLEAADGVPGELCGGRAMPLEQDGAQ